MICIILRKIDTDSTDYDLLIYCYLKVSLCKDPNTQDTTMSIFLTEDMTDC